MRYFERMLSETLVEPQNRPYSGMITMYKGMDETNFAKFKQHKIPGFMADLEMAMIYAQPTLTGDANETRILISSPIDLSQIENLFGIIDDMCMDWREEQPELKNRCWTADSSGHDTRGIYYGQPLKRFKVERIMRGESEWREFWDIIKKNPSPFMDFKR